MIWCDETEGVAPLELYHLEMSCSCGDTFWPSWRFRSASLLEALGHGLELARREVAWRRRATAGRQPPPGAQVSVSVRGPVDVAASSRSFVV